MGEIHSIPSHGLSPEQQSHGLSPEQHGLSPEQRLRSGEGLSKDKETKASLLDIIKPTCFLWLGASFVLEIWIFITLVPNNVLSKHFK